MPKSRYSVFSGLTESRLEISRDIRVERGVRQGCVITPLILNLYSEFMIREATEDVGGSVSMELTSRIVDMLMMQC